MILVLKSIHIERKFSLVYVIFHMHMIYILFRSVYKSSTFHSALWARPLHSVPLAQDLQSVPLCVEELYFPSRSVYMSLACSLALCTWALHFIPPYRHQPYIPSRSMNPSPTFYPTNAIFCPVLCTRALHSIPFCGHNSTFPPTLRVPFCIHGPYVPSTSL